MFRITPNERLGVLKQDQFAYEEFTVLDTVIMGHKELWAIKQERDRIYSLPEMSEEDGMQVADLEVEFAELDGYTAESRAGELLLGLDILLEQHNDLMVLLLLAGNCGCYWHKLYLPIQTLCYWTNQPITWILIPSVG